MYKGPKIGKFKRTTSRVSITMSPFMREKRVVKELERLAKRVEFPPKAVVPRRPKARKRGEARGECC